MTEKISEVVGKVSEVASNGLYIVLDRGERAFLPKENMYINKKKKLEEVFSVGFVIKAKVKSKKEDYLVLTQKEERQNDAKKEVKPTKKKQVKNKKETKNNKEEKQAKVANNPQQKVEKEEKEEPKQKTLKDLKKLQYIGNMKISVGKGKKANITELAEQKDEKIEYLDVPEGFLDNIVKTTKDAGERFSAVTDELRKRGLLDEH